MQKLAELYRGKAKTVYSTKNSNLLVLEFRNDTSAMDGQRIKQFTHKGIINNKFSYFIMKKLEIEKIPTQIEKLLSDNEVLVKKLDMISVECVIRNRAAGSLVKRLGLKEGLEIKPALFDLFLKNDAMHDPMINESYCIAFGWASKKHIENMQKLSYQVNNILSRLFDNAGFILIDFKLEFGLFKGNIVLGDEFSLDNCRLWDKNNLTKMDKDRFRQNLGNIIESYKEVARRIGVKLD
ncbi:phosphoribosylaminoimidazolesuccinocarboxamide synthase [Candidatus Fukatsuia anoeciicola]|uniref:phosphoribosylaminoimidazolesuccinocarboxamide synthase n=1 Tax=Candidatus Fukatsuia anoeciicola TaxID=2994492 RepID=UPI0034646E8F